jgi:L-asparaginase
MAIKILTTGGTIAKTYNEISGELIFDEKYLSKMLFQSRVFVEREVLMFKDSLDMNDKDREIILKAVENSIESKIIVMHGTDTIVDSAKVLSEVKDKTIVFMGSMIPYAFKNSDALFNFGFAMQSVQLLPNGVYICMNGVAFEWDEVKKNKEQGLFEYNF